MSELKLGYRAIFYSGEKKIAISQVKETYEQAQKEIERENELYDVFNYTPWTHAQVEKVYYRH